MKTSHKGFISPLLLALIALFLIGGGAYTYMQKKQVNQSAVVTTTTQATSTIQSQDNSGKILLGDRSSYENLSLEEKAIVDAYNNAHKVDPSLYILKHYDSTKILIGTLSVKGASSLSLVGRKDWKNIGENTDSLWTGGGYVESNEYAISVGNNDIFFYKVGDSTISSVSNSKLASGETYEESPGMGGGNYTIAFDEQTKTLTVTVYRGDLYGNGNGQKIRTVKFVLP